jgi:hypothetical protein
LTGKTTKNLGGGYAHVCAVAGNSGDNDADAVYCWGENGSGQLGNGVATGVTVTPNPLPIAANVPATATTLVAKYVTLGFAHTCVIYGNPTNDLTSALYCTGDNSDGQLGEGTNTSESNLTLVDISGINPGESYINIGVDSGNLDMTIAPNGVGVSASAQNELTVVTNNTSGYFVQISSNTEDNSLNGVSADIDATDADINSAAPLANNAWGFAISSSTPGAVTNTFDADYSAPSTVSKWAGVPILSNPKTVILSNSATPATGDKTNFYYAARANTAVPAGSYQTVIRYTVIKNP